MIHMKIWISWISLESESKVDLKFWSSEFPTKPIESFRRSDDLVWLRLVNISATWWESLWFVWWLLLKKKRSTCWLGINRHDWKKTQPALWWHWCGTWSPAKKSQKGSLTNCTPHLIWGQPWQESVYEQRQGCCETRWASSAEHSPSFLSPRTMPLLVDQ